jgi:hypothetical protein
VQLPEAGQEEVALLERAMRELEVLIKASLSGLRMVLNASKAPTASGKRKVSLMDAAQARIIPELEQHFNVVGDDNIAEAM